MSLKHLVARVLAQSRLIPPESKFAYIDKLSYPEDRDILVQFALQDPEAYRNRDLKKGPLSPGLLMIPMMITRNLLLRPCRQHL